MMNPLLKCNCNIQYVTITTSETDFPCVGLNGRGALTIKRVQIISSQIWNQFWTILPSSQWCVCPLTLTCHSEKADIMLQTEVSHCLPRLCNWKPSSVEQNLVVNFFKKQQKKNFNGYIWYILFWSGLTQNILYTQSLWMPAAMLNSHVPTRQLFHYIISLFYFNLH